MATPKPAVGPILHPLKTDIVHNRLAIPSPLLVHTVVKKRHNGRKVLNFPA